MLFRSKKDLAALKEKSSKIDDLIKNWEEVKNAASSMSYGGEHDIEIGADKQEAIVSDCDKEIEKLKKEKESIDKEIADLKESTLSEIDRIKEMVGLKVPEKKSKNKIVDESFESTERKIEKNIRASKKKKGASTKGSAEYAAKVAGKIAQYKAHGGGSGPTAKQKARMSEEESDIQRDKDIERGVKPKRKPTGGKDQGITKSVDTPKNNIVIATNSIYDGNMEQILRYKRTSQSKDQKIKDWREDWEKRIKNTIKNNIKNKNVGDKEEAVETIFNNLMK